MDILLSHCKLKKHLSMFMVVYCDKHITAILTFPTQLNAPRASWDCAIRCLYVYMSLSSLRRQKKTESNLDTLMSVMFICTVNQFSFFNIEKNLKTEINQDCYPRWGASFLFLHLKIYGILYRVPMRYCTLSKEIFLTNILLSNNLLEVFCFQATNKLL